MQQQPRVYAQRERKKSDVVVLAIYQVSAYSRKYTLPAPFASISREQYSSGGRQRRVKEKEKKNFGGWKQSDTSFSRSLARPSYFIRSLPAGKRRRAKLYFFQSVDILTLACNMRIFVLIWKSCYFSRFHNNVRFTSSSKKKKFAAAEKKDPHAPISRINPYSISQPL